MKAQPYPEYKPSGVKWLGDVPEHWAVIPIKHLVSTPITDGPHETPGIFNEGIPFVSAEAVSSGEINFAKIRGHISPEDHLRFSKKYHPQRGDIYLVKSGATTGRVAMVDTDKEFNIWSPLAAIRANPSIVDRFFLFFYLQSREFQKAIELSWSFGTQQNIGMGVIQNLDAPIPPVPEQTAIAAYLDRETGRIDELVAKKRELIERLKEKRTALISRTVTQGLPADLPAETLAKLEEVVGEKLPLRALLKSSGVDWLGEIPAHWKIVPLQYAFYNLDRRRIPVTGEDRANMEKRYPYYGASGIIDRVEDYIFDETLILVAEDGANLLSRSTPLAFLAKGKYWVNNHAHILRPAGGDIRYWASLLQIYDYTPLVTGAAQPKLTSERLGGIRLPCPPPHEQLAIATYLEKETASIDMLASKVEAAIERLQEYRTALITAAVTGKIDVREEAKA